MRRFSIELTAGASFAAPMMATIGVLSGKANSWIVFASVLLAATGAVGLALACRRDAPAAVIVKRIVALILLGVSVPVLSSIASAAAEHGSWGVSLGAALAFALICFGLSR